MSSNKKARDSFESPAWETSPRRNVILSLLPNPYWPEPAFDVAVVVADLGTLKYPVAVVLLTLLMTSSTAWRVPPVSNTREI